MIGERVPSLKETKALDSQVFSCRNVSSHWPHFVVFKKNKLKEGLPGWSSG